MPRGWGEGRKGGYHGVLGGEVEGGVPGEVGGGEGMAAV